MVFFAIQNFLSLQHSVPLTERNMQDRQEEKLVIFKTEAVLSHQKITQPAMTSKQIKISEDKTVSVMGTAPPISNRVVPRGPEFLLCSGYTGCFKVVPHRGFLNDVFTKGTDALESLCKASFIVCHMSSSRSFPELLWTQYRSTTSSPRVQLHHKTSQQFPSGSLPASLNGMRHLLGLGQAPLARAAQRVMQFGQFSGTREGEDL